MLLQKVYVYTRLSVALMTTADRNKAAEGIYTNVFELKLDVCNWFHK